MKESFKNKASEMLRFEEGVRRFPYHDQAGKLTIGVGHNLTDTGISKNTITQLLEEDILEAYVSLCKIFGMIRFDAWSQDRRLALINMVFNLGEGDFREFDEMITAIRSFDWKLAAAEALDSKWAKQVPHRARRVASMLEEG